MRMRSLSPLQRLDLIVTPAMKSESPAQSRARHSLRSDGLVLDGHGAHATVHAGVSDTQPRWLELSRATGVPCRSAGRPGARSVHLLAKTDETAAASDDIIEIPFEAHDDLGIVAAELVVTTENVDGTPGKVLSVQRIPLGDQQGSRHVRGKVRLDLKSLGLEAGGIDVRTRCVSPTLGWRTMTRRLSPRRQPPPQIVHADDVRSRTPTASGQSESANPAAPGEMAGEPGNLAERTPSQQNRPDQLRKTRITQATP